MCVFVCARGGVRLLLRTAFLTMLPNSFKASASTTFNKYKVRSC